MIGTILLSVLIGAIITIFVMLLIHLNSKAYKAQENMIDKYMILDHLWLRTGLSNSLAVTFKNQIVDVRVRCNCLPGTNKWVRVYSVDINNITCATGVRLHDGVTNTFSVCVDDEFDEQEVWGIIMAANNATLEAEQEKVKKSVLTTEET